MIQFDKLRIQGFKSFVEKTELEIGPGLNGVVGPNGCGKSNLVEALRWVMGETSAKRMRGGGMEDVIFAGTDKRPARNIAEVSLLLDNTKREAPAAHNNSDELEIIRRIERDRGSSYRINGKTVRARDVQMLFADSVSGANSPAMVSQGRVTEIINAKPSDRRLILEESAGISGLFVRRHEAELRLKAAETNLERLQDVVGSMESRYNSLKKQVKQATHYRNLNAQIRQLELLLAYMEYTEIQDKQAQVKQNFAQAESQTAEKLATVTQLTKTQTTQSEDIPALRNAEAEVAAALQNVKITLQRMEEEIERQKQAKSETTAQLEQAQSDYQHEKQILNESAQGLEKIQSEHEQLVEDEKNDSGKLEEKQAIVDQLEEKVSELEKQYNDLIQGEADRKARKQSLEQQIAQNKERLQIMTERREKAQADLKKLLEKDKNSSVINSLEKEIKALNEKAEQDAKDLSQIGEQLSQLEEQQEQARKELENANAAQSEYKAELSTLESFFAQMDQDHAPILEQITTEKGFEKAISRALGDSLMASTEEGASSLWRAVDRDSLPALPGGIQSLKNYIDAPKELHSALSQIGVVEDEEQGETLSRDLQVGQSLVSANGTYWRWDGYFVKATASDQHSLQLEQKNKLTQLQAKAPQIEQSVTKARDAFDSVQKKLEETKTRRAQMQREEQETDTALTQKRQELSTLREENARFASEKEHLETSIQTASDDIETLSEVIEWDQQRLDQLGAAEQDQGGEQTEALRHTLTESRAELQNAIRTFDMLQQKQNSRAARMRAIADERVNLKNRSIRSRDRLQALEARQAELKDKLSGLDKKPETRDNEREELLSQIADLEEKRNHAAEKLAQSEGELTETNKALKEAQEQLSLAREQRAGAQATMQGLVEQMDHMTLAIREKFDLAPEELKSNLTIDPESKGNLDQVRSEKDSLSRERDSLGAVNLRAEEEMQELESELGQIFHERDDLTAAIEELRTAIHKINKEARERLAFAFDQVNRHFQRLFVQLFHGGEAYLALIDSDDPLTAGLEIYAQPPGKSLQSLSLLSGGEQTMASIALIFAMFLTNPSPICVLDEIDAPLDDANVDRVCDLLDEIAERGETRFVIITHHRLTMARMNRLYGVTMAEKGVSQLVSVDLQQSFGFLDEAA